MVHTLPQPADKIDIPDAHPDPLSGAPGAHPVGTGLGAVLGGAAAGAAAGAAGGPIGAAIGIVAGAVVGGLAGKATAEVVEPTVEDAYWQANYRHRPYVAPDAEYEVYRPAYRFGWEARRRYPDRTFDDVEAELERDWRAAQGQIALEWPLAKTAARDAYDRVGHVDLEFHPDGSPMSATPWVARVGSP